ncbi:MAG: HAD family hydrolase [Pseudomonadota bacterium]
MIRIAMFSGPRNISTAMMRAFGARPDTRVFDEPFYGCYLASTGADHPMRDEILAAWPTDQSDAVARLKRPADAGETFSFEKHIAFHFAQDENLDWLAGSRIFHLIRDPRSMVASYARKFDDVSPITQSYRVQRAIDERFGPGPVVDADDVLARPEKTLQKLCAALDVPFKPEMLSWPAGPRAEDGPWAPHWYDAVSKSTGFGAPTPPPAQLSARLEEAASRCMDDYAYFRSRRLH